MRKQTNIISVFGQIEGVIADALVAERKATRIDFENIPISARYDEHGRAAHCALVLSTEAEREFDRRVRELKA
jgi:hypothetical protein